MSGGIAYIYDNEGDFSKKCNNETFEIEKIIEEDEKDLKDLISKHLDYTESDVASFILEDWNNQREKFIKVMPTDYKRVLNEMKNINEQSNG